MIKHLKFAWMVFGILFCPGMAFYLYPNLKYGVEPDWYGWFCFWLIFFLAWFSQVTFEIRRFTR